MPDLDYTTLQILVSRSVWDVISEKFDLSANAFLTWYGVIQSIPTEWKNLIRNTNFSVEYYSQEVMINYRQGILLVVTFTELPKLKLA